ncbi:mitochondrial carrier [Viridothelium virens]|uniref:Mitochondrial glycine transporter n=1 Tax=Viridothelium virens TaxID=1048519 RepID=A0A6A6H9T2_VIRVR|nr:mitochondrial carrier [Viridothelium virens]
MSHGVPQRKSSSSFHFAAGLLSGTFTAALLQPADLLKTRVQQSHSTSLTSSLRAIAAGPSPLRQLWRGTVPSILRTGLGSALYFSGLNALRRGVSSASGSEAVTNGNGKVGAGRREGAGRDGEEGEREGLRSSSVLPRLSSGGNMLTGALARAAAGLVMMPITVIKVRYESSYYAYSGLAGAGRDILRTEGVGGLFKGWGATAIRDAPYAGLYVVFYEEGKRRLASLSAFGGLHEDGGDAEGWSGRRREGMTAKASASINFVSGILAAALATAITNPFDAIKTRLQLMPAKYGNMLSAARTMLREEGTRSFMDGLGLRIGRKAVSSALAWTVYEEAIRRAEMKFIERKEEEVL